MAEEGDAVNALDALEPVTDEGDEEERLQGSDDVEGEDLIHDNMQQDYRANSALDRYEDEGLDDQEALEDVDLADALAARRAAEEELDRRDGRETMRASRRRLPTALADVDDDDDDRPRRRARHEGPEEDEEDVPEDEALASAELLHANAVKGPLAEWIVQPAVNQQIRRWFRRFLKKFEEHGTYVYRERIKDMAENNRTSLEVHFPHLATFEKDVRPDSASTVALWTAEQPKLMLAVLKEGAREVVFDSEVYGELADAWAKSVGAQLEIHVRVVGLPMMDDIRNLRHHHLNSLVKITGVVTRRTGVFPQLSLVHYDCLKCSYTMGPFAQAGGENDLVRPNACPQCQSKGPFQVNVGETVYRDFQKMTLQESPGTVPAGRLPRHKEVILLHDLIDVARPGEEVEVTGIYQYGYDVGLNIRNSFPVFSTNLEANYISKREDLFSIYALTDEDKATILNLARDPRIGQRIVKSIAPSIYGHENIKTALALALFGGQEKYPSPAHRLRGDINILLLGDPGVAKSQFLKYVEKTAMRAVYTTGKGASAVGLTAAVHKDAITKEWTLEGGALVLADKGVCLIDEFDKMNDQDRVSIHEAMEQQSISISKAGIVTSLQARCAVIAAANPVGGRYDPSRTFAENVELSDPILSRFDVLCVIRDQVDPVQDAKLAHFVVGSHARCHPDRDGAVHDPQQAPSAAELDPDILPQELLRKYITYAKQSCRPQMQAADYDRIKNVYAELRQAACRTHGMPVAVRHLESIIRMSEAHARIHLREYVTGDDINVAIKAMVQSFVQTQKYSVQPVLERRFRRYLTCGSDFHQLLLTLLRGLLREEMHNVSIMGGVRDGEELYKIPIRNLEEKAREHEIIDLQDFYKSALFTGNSFNLDATRTHIVYHA